MLRAQFIDETSQLSVKMNNIAQALNNLRKSRIAITGASGYIGTILVSIFDSNGIKWINLEGDICMPENFRGDFDILFHLAAAVPKKFENNFSTSFRINVEGLLNAAEACLIQGAKLIFPSTGAVIGINQSNSILGSTARSQYAASKLIGERICEFIANHNGLRVVVIRIFNLYGHNQSEDYLLGELVAKIMSGSVLNVHSPDSQRDFIHVDDAVNAILQAACFDGPFTIFDIGSGQNISMREIAQKLEGKIKRPMNIIFGSGNDEMPVGQADITNTEKLLGWKPTISLDDGLEEILKYCFKKY